MAGGALGAVLVSEGERLLGIFTSRDAVARVLAQGLDARATLLSAVMTPDPIAVTPERSFGYALQLMQQHGFGHVPVVDGGRAVGIVTARNAGSPTVVAKPRKKANTNNKNVLRSPKVLM